MLILIAAFLGVAAMSDLFESHSPGRISRVWRIGDFIVRRELWSSACLERGVGPWGFENEDPEWIPEDLEERMLVYEEKANLRLCLPSYDHDSPPEGSGDLVHSAWVRLDPPIREGFVYDAVHFQVWRVKQ